MVQTVADTDMTIVVKFDAPPTEAFEGHGLIFEQEKFVGAGDGALSTRGGHSLLGAFRRDGGFGYFVTDPGEKFEPSLTLFVRLPPHQDFEGGSESELPPPPTKR